MAGRTFSHAQVDGQAIIRALNTPGGGAYKWRDNMMRDMRGKARAIAPVNRKENALHRGGVTGTYKKGLKIDRRGSNQHIVKGNLRATAPHSRWVEDGRPPNRLDERRKPMRFSWLHADPTQPGEYGPYGPVLTHFVKGYEGHKVLLRAFAYIANQRNIQKNIAPL